MKIAVSACLLGEQVRFDKGHKRDAFVMDALSAYVEYVPFCPEHLAFGTPRPSIRMVRDNEVLKIISNKTKENLTSTLLKSSLEELNQVSSKGLCGIILKSKSPTCGLKSSKVYLDNGFVEGKENGVFANLCQENFPLLPMEEEGRLNDPWLRENFIMQVFAYSSFENFKKSASMQDLVNFHRVNKFMLQSKDEKLYRELGYLVGNHEKRSLQNIIAEYETLFKTAISKKSSIGKTKNVLEHMAGFLKKLLNTEEKSMLHEQIHDYVAQIVPLIVPLSTLRLYALKYDLSYLLEQKFLSPYPKELALRSDVQCVR